jgi:DNA-binding LacI/PurR family transcriptional regulator
VDAMLSQSQQPTAVFVPADLIAASLYSIVADRGLRPGKDIEVISVNAEMAILQGLRPRPATVDIRAYDVGRAAVKRALWRLKHPQKEPGMLTVTPVLYKGDE